MVLWDESRRHLVSFTRVRARDAWPLQLKPQRNATAQASAGD